jgi:rare lipoprotein A
VRVRYVGPARLDHATEPLYAVSPAPRPAPVAPARPQPVSRPVQEIAGTGQPNDGFAVQAGAFSDPQRADAVAASLTAAGPASVWSIDVGGRLLYRVMVSGLADPVQAEQARQRVVALGYADARVIRN